MTLNLAAVDSLLEAQAVTYGLRRRGTTEIIGCIPTKVAERPATSDEFNRDYEETPLFGLDTVRALVDRVRELELDAARIEWLAERFKTCTVRMNGEHPWSPHAALTQLRGPTFRAAIDAAMEQPQGERNEG